MNPSLLRSPSVRRVSALGVVALMLAACGGGGPVVGGRQQCTAGVVRALTDAGDEALCRVPVLACDAAEDLESVTQCHYPPSASPSSACCSPRPAGCTSTDCDCLLRNGPWIDASLADDAGISFVDYAGPRWKCSYRVSCTPAADGGVAVLACTPA
jgi:hypothetical protein